MCEPTLLLTMGSVAMTAGGGLFSAGTQARAGERQGRLAIWQALQESAAGFAEAGDVSEALVEQFGDTSQALIDQAKRANDSYGLAVEIARKNVEASLGRANAEENRVREETGRQLAAQSTFYAANNIDAAYGSPLMLAAFGAAQGETDALIVRARGIQDAADQQWAAFGLADRAQETAEAAGATVTADAKATRRNIESAFKTAGTKATGVNTTARIGATNARKAGQLGAATTLLSTGSTLFQQGMSGKLSGIGIKGA